MSESAFDTVFRRVDGVGAVAIDRKEKTEARVVTRASVFHPNKTALFYFNTIIFFISTNIREPSPGRASRR